MKALSLHQPWASLVALGVKTIETRSWSTSYRGPLAIHAAKRTPEYGLEVGRWTVCPSYPRGDELVLIGSNTGHVLQVKTDREDPRLRHYVSCSCGWTGPRRDPIPLVEFERDKGRHLRDTDRQRSLPLGAVVATCELVDVVPIYDANHKLDLAWEHHVAETVSSGELWLWEGPSDTEAPSTGRPSWLHRDIADQRPYGDFTPGRFAWLLGDIVPLDPPVPAKGHQGLWAWEVPS